MTDPQVHVMLDLETFGNGNSAAIVSIGAVKFDAIDILDAFHVGVELESCTRLGLRMDPDTILWWMHPDRTEARQVLFALDKVDLHSALYGLNDWLADGDEIKAIWGNGSTFDNVILRSAYAAAGMEYPVKFWQDHCYRTMKAYAPGIAIEREGVHHSAVDDARSQAKHLQAIARWMGISL